MIGNARPVMGYPTPAIVQAPLTAPAVVQAPLPTAAVIQGAAPLMQPAALSGVRGLPAPSMMSTVAPRGMSTSGRIGKRGLAVEKKADFELGKPFKPRNVGVGETHALICALDYLGTACPLTCSIDGKNMQALAQAAGIVDVEAMYDTQCTKQGIIDGITRTAQKCKPGDTFFFFFAGHGMSSTDYDGDEIDGQDENYVCDFTNQQMDPAKHYLSDDEFAALVTRVVNPQVNVIVCSDCCHSGSVCDFAKRIWKGFNAVSISGCRDSQTSGDTGKGGICTHSLMLAIEQLQKEGKNNYSCGQLFRKTIFIDDTMMGSAQDIQFDKAPDCSPNAVPWPLIPKGPFTAPYNSASGLLGGGAAAAPAGAIVAAASPAILPSAVSPGIIQPSSISTGAGVTYAAASPSVNYAPAQSAAIIAASSPAISTIAAPLPTVAYASPAPVVSAIAAPSPPVSYVSPAPVVSAIAAPSSSVTYGSVAPAVSTIAAPSALPATVMPSAVATTTSTSGGGMFGSLASAKPQPAMVTATPMMALPTTTTIPTTTIPTVTTASPVGATTTQGGGFFGGWL